jgi:hypothetical protein
MVAVTLSWAIKMIPLGHRHQCLENRQQKFRNLSPKIPCRILDLQDSKLILAFVAPKNISQK